MVRAHPPLLREPRPDAERRLFDAAFTHAPLIVEQASLETDATTGGSSVLRSTAIRALVAAESVSTTGGQMTAVALPWFVLTTSSAKQMSYVVAAEIAAYVIFGIPAGSVIGRLGARKTMVLCDGLRAPLMLLIPVLHLAGALVFAELVAISFVLGALSAPYGGAQRVITAELLEDDPGAVGQANALFQGATRITLVAGPPLAGVLIGVIGATNVLVIDAATFAAAFLLLTLFVPAPRRRARRDDEPAPKLLDGLRYLRKDRLLASFSGALVIGDGAFQVIFISLPGARRRALRRARRPRRPLPRRLGRRRGDRQRRRLPPYPRRHASRAGLPRSCSYRPCRCSCSRCPSRRGRLRPRSGCRGSGTAWSTRPSIRS